jgi:hypothetical protein
MDRQISDRNILDQFCEDFCGIVEQHTQYVVVSGFVAIVSGRVRGTEDIDMIIPRLDLKQFTALHDSLCAGGFACMQSDDANEIFDYLDKQLSVRYTRVSEFLPEMEVKFSKDALDIEMIARRRKLPVTGLQVWFSDINANIAFKEHYLKSDKDMEDAKHMRAVFHDEIDEDEITRYKALIMRYRL